MDQYKSRSEINMDFMKGQIHGKGGNAFVSELACGHVAYKHPFSFFSYLEEYAEMYLH